MATRNIILVLLALGLVAQAQGPLTVRGNLAYENCATNSFFNSTRLQCQCLPYWDGPSCETYIGDCHPKCLSGCYGPSATQCDSCVANASEASNGACACDEGWTLPDCSLWAGACTEGNLCESCTTGAGVCDSCIANAQFIETDGWPGDTCECSSNWEGDLCENYVGLCSTKCKACTGVTDAECLQCHDNADWSVFGTCECNAFWEGAACDIYSGACHVNCRDETGCRGQGPEDCFDCAPNASFGPQGSCHCDIGYGGAGCTRYVGNCDSKCYICAGPGRRDCTFCVENAIFNSDNECACKAWWSGESCEYYIGTCHALCDECHGPGVDDCDSCSTNANKNGKGECECKIGFGGADCTVPLAYTGVCDDKCKNGCSGPTSRDCIDCIDNGVRDFYGNCVCDHGWSGLRCETQHRYNGRCFPTCATCNGPYASDCLECVDNAYKDMYGTCICTEYWTGLSCTFSLINNGPCCSSCMGCTGAAPTDCLQCVPNAYRAADRTCQCLANWGGEDCSIYTGPCDHLCIGCDGPNACDCFSCAKNASQDIYGNCICDAGWSGHYCEIYCGECHKMCDDSAGCVGPDCDDCLAYRENVSFCECDRGWSGDCCEIWAGTCHERCHGCNGPTDFDCDTCIPHSSWNTNGKCVCDPGFVGKHCDTYEGECNGACIECTGPTAADCVSCVDHAHLTENDECVCDVLYAGDHCFDFIGACDIACQDCYGPQPDQCTLCTPHAEFDVDGICKCEEGWTTSAWDHHLGFDADDTDRTWTGDFMQTACQQYIGACHPHCSRSQVGAIDSDNWPGLPCPFGPTAADCTRCVSTAFRNESGACECMEYYTGADCSEYRGPCYHACANCTGPGIEHCQLPSMCVEHASYVFSNQTWGCKCDSNYIAPYCTIYRGDCDSKCYKCHGPSADQCEQCIDNAVYVQGAGCLCSVGYSGSKCTTFDQSSCNAICYGCTGYYTNECVECVEHAFRDLQGHCVCEEEWTGADCSRYRGMNNNWFYAQHDYQGPHGFTTVNYLTPRGYNGGAPRIDESGSDVSFLQSGCHATCDVCTGPGSNECSSCVAHASYSSTGYCTCDEDWSGDDCTGYIGECANECKLCFGPSAGQCVECVENSGRNTLGVCVCNTGWAMPDCPGCMWDNSVSCYHTCTTCTGPSFTDCESCVPQAHYEPVLGGCVCDEDWDSAGCTSYSGVCHPYCLEKVYGENFDSDDLTDQNRLLCSGPNSLDCFEYMPGVNSDGDGCLSSWYGMHCEIYLGACTGLCAYCPTGPNNCETCGYGATWSPETLDALGNVISPACTCMDGYQVSGPVNFCSWSSTATLGNPCDNAPTSYECINTCENSSKMYLTEDRNCVCAEGWTGTECELYTGPCADGCASCTGPSIASCVSCRSDLEGNRDSDDATTSCDCYTGWVGYYCESYIGECGDYCDNCRGGGMFECTDCVDNAVYTSSGDCACLAGWTSTTADTYECTDYDSAYCDPVCEGYCTNPYSCSYDCLIDTQINVWHKVKNPSTGLCECAPGWIGIHCNYWAGVCAPGCLGCLGPRPSDCLFCDHVAGVDSDDGQGLVIDQDDSYGYGTVYQGIECMCHDDDFIGPDCDIYIGECSSTCDKRYGCTGPYNDHCIRCRDGYEWHETSYGCSWLNDSPKQGNVLNCAVYDEVDENAQPNDLREICLECQDGYYLSGFNTCTACSDSNCNQCRKNPVQEFEVCIGCITGYYTSDVNPSACLACHADCLTCEFSATSCTSCDHNAILDLSTNICKCISPLVRHPTTRECELSCPTLFEPNRLNECVSIVEPNSSLRWPEHDFNRYTPVTFESEHLPRSAPLRGDYFDGVRDYIELKNFEPYAKSRFDVWVLVIEPGTLVSMHEVQVGSIHSETDRSGQSKRPANIIERDWRFSEEYYYQPNPTFSDFRDSLEYAAWANANGESTTATKVTYSFHINPLGYAVVSDDVGSYAGLTQNNVIGKWSYLRMSINNNDRVTPVTPVTPTQASHTWNYTWDSDDGPQRRLDISGEDQELIDTICDTTVWVQHFGSTGLLEENKISATIRRSPSMDHVSHPDEYRTPLYNPQTKTFVGAYWGNTHHFQGMLYFMEYNLAPSIGSDLEYIPNLEVCSEFDAQAHFTNGIDSVECPGRCRHDQYVDDDGQCCDCHDSCVYGCSNAEPCLDCHADCATCSGCSNTQCTSCYEGAELDDPSSSTGSTCSCRDPYEGEAEHCSFKLVDTQCKVQFYDDNKFQCHECIDGFYFGHEWESYNCQFDLDDCTDYTSGLNDCGTSYYAVMDNTGTNCLPGYYNNNGTCTACVANCLQCSSSICDVCALGFYKHQSGDGRCYDYCPTGFVGFYSNDVCVGSCGPVAEFNFVQELIDGDRIWKYQGCNQVNILEDEFDNVNNWEICARGGWTEEVECADPYPTLDRGLWFSGVNDHLELNGLILNSDFSIDMWIKAHGNGALFSSAIVMPYHYYGQSTSLLINDRRLTLSFGYYGDSSTTGSVLAYYTWCHVAVSADAFALEAKTDLQFFINNQLVKEDSVRGYQVDYPDQFNSHKIGAEQGDNCLINVYKGYIFSFNVYNYPKADYSDVVRMPCAGCDACPEYTGQCLGICNWSAYWDGTKCEMCPSWCPRGCQSSVDCGMA